MSQNLEIKKAIVIGAGIAGLAVAIRLKKQDYNVDVFVVINHIGGGIPLCLLFAKITSVLRQHHE